MKKLLSLLVLLVIFGCQQQEELPLPPQLPVLGGAPGEMQAEALLTGTAMEPAEITITAGSSVTFINIGSRAQQLVGDVESSEIGAGGRFEHTFEAKGVYTFNVLPAKYEGTVIVE